MAGLVVDLLGVGGGGGVMRARSQHGRGIVGGRRARVAMILDLSNLLLICLTSLLMLSYRYCTGKQ